MSQAEKFYTYTGDFGNVNIRFVDAVACVEIAQSTLTDAKWGDLARSLRDEWNGLPPYKAIEILREVLDFKSSQHEQKAARPGTHNYWAGYRSVCP